MLTLAWNLAHQVKVRPIPDNSVEAIFALDVREIGCKAVPDFDTVVRHDFLFPIHFG